MRASTTILQAVSDAPPAGDRLRCPEPCVLVIVGASGDLARRKLVPSLAHLLRDGLLPADFAIVGVGRTGWDDEAFRAAMRGGLDEFGPHPGAELWERLAPRLSYVSGDLANAATFAAVGRHLAKLEATLPPGSGRMIYLAIPPSVVPIAIEHLSASGVAPRVRDPSERPWVRIIVEKPFGTSLRSAVSLNGVVRAAFAEHQVYRIDHYLAKETVQNLLVLRFANSIFEPVWNRQHVDHVQITAAESVGVEHRARYYEESGVVRDMFQSHLLQLLALTAMEPPSTANADSVRNEKAKVLRAIRPIPPAEFSTAAVMGQYGAGTAGGPPVAGYRHERDVAPRSTTPTYAALRLHVDNWRWQGVPFFLRSGKCLPRRATEIAIRFRRPPHLMFPLPPGQDLESNTLALHIQPQESIVLRFEIKVPGIEMSRMAPVDMEFDYGAAFGGTDHDAYETLLLDAMLGDATLFTRSDEVEAAWTVVDPVLNWWEEQRPSDFPNYAAGTWGPAAADALIGSVGARWREP
jgi:glucose-6-phosphate 1-dehydrogenase